MRRRLRYTLRTLLFLVTVFAVLAAMASVRLAALIGNEKRWLRSNNLVALWRMTMSSNMRVKRRRPPGSARVFHVCSGSIVSLSRSPSISPEARVKS